MGTRKPDEPYGRAKSGASLRDRKRKRRAQLSLAQLMKGARGVLDSGTPDLASNPRHLQGLGRNLK
jgi:hypothetical protein